MSDTYAPPRSLGRARSSGWLRPIINGLGLVVVLVALPAVIGPAYLAAQTGTQFGTGDLATTDFMTALAGFLLATALGVGLVFAKARVGRRGR